MLEVVAEPEMLEVVAGPDVLDVAALDPLPHAPTTTTANTTYGATDHA
jgi:hypothetical protein